MSMFAGLSALCCFALSPYPKPLAHKHTLGHCQRMIPQTERRFDSDIFKWNNISSAWFIIFKCQREKASRPQELYTFQTQVLSGCPYNKLSQNVIHNDIQIKLKKVSGSLWILKMFNEFNEPCFFHLSFCTVQKGHVHIHFKLFFFCFAIMCSDVSVYTFC